MAQPASTASPCICFELYCHDAQDFTTDHALARKLSAFARTAGSGSSPYLAVLDWLKRCRTRTVAARSCSFFCMIISVVPGAVYPT